MVQVIDHYFTKVFNIINLLLMLWFWFSFKNDHLVCEFTFLALSNYILQHLCRGLNNH